MVATAISTVFAGTVATVFTGAETLRLSAARFAQFAHFTAQAANFLGLGFQHFFQFAQQVQQVVGVDVLVVALCAVGMDSFARFLRV